MIRYEGCSICHKNDSLKYKKLNKIFICLGVHAEEEIYKGKHAPSKEHPRNAVAVLVSSAPSTLTHQGSENRAGQYCSL